MSDGSVGNNGERMVSGTNDWGYYANLSIYKFFSEFVAGKRILEIGCGTGYGANYLSNHAKRIVSLDVDEPAVSFCASHATSDRIDFRLHDLSAAPLTDEAFEVIVTSNTLEHIPPIDDLLSNAARLLQADGVCLIAVPPITSPHCFAVNFSNIFHTNNLTPLNWYVKLSRYFEQVQCFSHWVTPEFEGHDGALLGMGLPADETVIREHDFLFERQTAHSLNANHRCITAIFAVRCPRAQVGQPSLDEEPPRDWHIQQISSRVMQEEIKKKAALAQYYKDEFARVQIYCESQHEEILELSARLHVANNTIADLTNRK